MSPADGTGDRISHPFSNAFSMEMMKAAALQNEDLVFLGIGAEANSALMKPLDITAVDNGR